MFVHIDYLKQIAPDDDVKTRKLFADERIRTLLSWINVLLGRGPFASLKLVPISERHSTNYPRSEGGSAVVRGRTGLAATHELGARVDVMFFISFSR